VACGRRRDGASWLAWMSIRSGRYVPSSENPPGQPVALEGPECPGRDVGPATEFVRQFRFRRQPGPRRVFAAPDPPREHRVNVRVGLRVPPRIIQTSHTGSVTAPAPADSLCSIWNSRAWPHQRMVYAGVTTSPGRRHDRTCPRRRVTQLRGMSLRKRRHLRGPGSCWRTIGPRHDRISSCTRPRRPASGPPCPLPGSAHQHARRPGTPRVRRRSIPGCPGRPSPAL
jgi:hypothetical protein